MISCEMTGNCTAEVTHLDENGYIYCTGHGIQRRSWKNCRKLRPHELSRLRRGQQVTRY
jgi:hypothetical protein